MGLYLGQNKINAGIEESALIPYAKVADVSANFIKKGEVDFSEINSSILDISTRVSSLETTDFVTSSELDSSLSNFIKKGEVDFSELNSSILNISTRVNTLENAGYIKGSDVANNIPAGYITETELNAKNYLTSYTETDPIWTSEKSNYPTLNDISVFKKTVFLTKSEYNAITTKETDVVYIVTDEEISAGETVDLTPINSSISDISTRLSNIANAGYIKGSDVANYIPSKYITEDELATYNYITASQVGDNIPSKYITEDELATYNYITASQVGDNIPSKYITEDELAAENYLKINDVSIYAKKADIQVATTPTKNRYVGTITDCDSQFYIDEAEYISNIEFCTWCDGTGGNYEIDNTEHQYTYNGETYKYKVSYSGTFGDEYTFTFYFEVPNFDTFSVTFLGYLLKRTSGITQVAGSAGYQTWKEYVDGNFIKGSDVVNYIPEKYITEDELTNAIGDINSILETI